MMRFWHKLNHFKEKTANQLMSIIYWMNEALAKCNQRQSYEAPTIMVAT